MTLSPGGMLSKVLGGARDAVVNSLHGQGIDRRADRAIVEATAPDGLVEAFRRADAAGFVLAVRWHPEWRALEKPLSRALFQAFGDAVRAHAANRTRAAAD